MFQNYFFPTELKISFGEIQTREQYASDLTFVSCSQLSITVIIYLCDTANRLMKLRVY